MRRTLLLLLLPPCLLLSACKPAPPPPPVAYAKHGLSFTYAGTFTLEDECTGNIHHLSLERSGNILIIMVFPSDLAKPLTDFAHDFSAAANDSGEFPSTRFSPLTPGLRGDTITEAFTATALGVKVHFTRRFQSFTQGDKTMFIIEQAADEAWPRMEPLFAQVVNSVQQSTTPVTAAPAAPGNIAPIAPPAVL